MVAPVGTQKSLHIRAETKRHLQTNDTRSFLRANCTFPRHLFNFLKKKQIKMRCPRRETTVVVHHITEIVYPKLEKLHLHYLCTHLKSLFLKTLIIY